MHYFIKIVTVLLLILASVTSAQAQTIIRDAEIETYIRTMSEPIFVQAGLNPQDVNIVLINDPAINAFVAGGQNIFLNTGLILKAEDVGELIGVIAHETGHIAAGHLVRSQEVGREASTQAIISTLLGAAVGLAGGGSEAAGAVIAGGQANAIGYALKNSRTYEASADQAAIAYLDDAGYSGRGMVQFLQRLADQELLPTSQQSDYLRTHPLTRDRVNSVTAAVENTRHKDQSWPSEFDTYHQKIRAKIYGFLHPDQVALEYQGRDDFSARYARAIAQYRRGEVDQALNLIDQFIMTENISNKGYLHELKGQILLENGRIDEAITAYSKAAELLPNQALIRLELAKTMLQRLDNSLIPDVITHLTHAQKGEAKTPRLYRLLATAHGRIGNDGLAKLYLAEEAFLLSDMTFAMQQAKLAQDVLPKESSAWQRAQDLIEQIKTVKN